jgi:hypothetical protein
VARYEPNPDELAFVTAFCNPNVRRRLVALLKTERGRAKAVDRLAHCGGLDDRYVRWIEPQAQTLEGVVGLLRALNAPETCRLVSEDDRLDGATLSLHEALSRVIGSSIATLVLCDPQRLAYFEGEEQDARAVLCRN